MSAVVTEMRQVNIDDLRLAENNPRYITPSALDRLKRAMDRDPDMMEARPVIALPDGTVIAGNMRLRAARDLGWKTIATVYADLDEQRAKLWMLRDNNEYGDWGDSSLANLLTELQEDGADLEMTGFDTHSLNKLLKSLEPQPEETAPQMEEVTYSILVSCADEEHQAVLAAALEEQGLTIKMLMA